MSCCLVFLESFMIFPLSRKGQHFRAAARIVARSVELVNQLFPHDVNDLPGAKTLKSVSRVHAGEAVLKAAEV